MYNIPFFEQNIFGDKMAITLVRAIIIYICVTMAVRVMGKRQVGQLNPQELVITILISAVATVPLEDNGMPLANSLVPIGIFISLELINSALSMKSFWFRNLVQGKPIFLIKDGKIDQEQLKKLRYTMDDLIDGVRQAGVFDISQVQNAIVETNGTLSVQPKAKYTPVTPKDLNIVVEEAEVPITIAIDGNAVESYFGGEHQSKDSIRLTAVINKHQLENILLMNINKDGTAYIVEKEQK